LAGGVITHDMIPDVDEMRQWLCHAQLRPLEIQDAPDRYIAAARKNTGGAAPIEE
jgi:hypothetical protein